MQRAIRPEPSKARSVRIVRIKATFNQALIPYLRNYISANATQAPANPMSCGTRSDA